MMSDNPLADFSAATLIETRKQLEAKKHNEGILVSIHREAKFIRHRLQTDDLSRGYVTLRLRSPTERMHRENYVHLIANGYRVWVVDEIRTDATYMSYHITWDCDDFRPKYEDYIAVDKLYGNHIRQSSYSEATPP